jgi:hypothetical protein
MGVDFYTRRYAQHSNESRLLNQDMVTGLATIVIAVASLWVLQDFPQTAKMLTEPERLYFCTTPDDET